MVDLFIFSSGFGRLTDNTYGKYSTNLFGPFKGFLKKTKQTNSSDCPPRCNLLHHSFKVNPKYFNKPHYTVTFFSLLQWPSITPSQFCPLWHSLLQATTLWAKVGGPKLSWGPHLPFPSKLVSKFPTSVRVWHLPTTRVDCQCDKWACCDLWLCDGKSEGNPTNYTIVTIFIMVMMWNCHSTGSRAKTQREDYLGSLS